MANSQKEDAAEALTKIFHEMDRDKDGSIDLCEVEEILTQHYKDIGSKADKTRIRTEALVSNIGYWGEGAGEEGVTREGGITGDGRVVSIRGVRITGCCRLLQGL